jgi:autotransporter-associated beta strand protein
MKNQTLPQTLALLAGALLITNSVSAAPKTWAVGAPPPNWSSSANWSPAGAPAAGDDVTFTNVGGVAYVVNNTPITNNVVDAAFSARLNSLAFNQTNCSHGTLITAPGLAVSGTAAAPNPLYVGSGQDEAANGVLSLAAISGSSLSITNTNSPIIIQQGGATSVATRRATLNLAGLNTFTASVQKLLIAYEDDSANQHRRPAGTLLLAKTNYITCTIGGTPALGNNSAVGYSIAEVHQQAGNAATNRLGQVNFFNVNAMKFGGAKTASTYVNFNSGWVNPSVTFRNAAGTGRQNAWYIGDDSTTSGSSSGCTSILDLTGGTVDALVDTVYVGVGQAANTSFYVGGNGTLTFNQGIMDVNTLELGYQYAAGSSAARGAFNVNGTGQVVVHKDIRLARNLGPGTGTLVTNGIGVLTINGGSVQVSGNVVDGGGVSTITITNGGTLNLQPAGDTIPGNIAVRVLNIGSGTLTNFATLSVSNLNVLAPANQFTLYPGQTLAPVGIGLTGTLTVAFDLGTPGGANNDQVAVLGSLALKATNTILVNPLSGFAAGAYPVMTYGAAGLTGDVTTNLKLGGAIADSRYSLLFDANTPSTVTLNVSGGPAANLTWSGDGVGNVWNLHQTFNWNDSGGANDAKFFNLDTVTFDDTGSASPAINVVGTLLPSSVNVNGTKSYTLSGSGKISGGAGLAYGSTGTLIVLTTNDYTGTTAINSGTVQVGNGTTADGGIATGEIDNYGALIFNSASSQNVPGIITGTGTITKRGPGVTLLAGANTFTAAVTNEAGTLMAGNNSALGDTSFGTTINSGATLDLGGFNLGDEPIYVSGTGVGSAGAIVNSVSLPGIAQNVTLLGPTTFGGTAAWSINPASTTDGLLGNGYKVSKVSSNEVAFGNANSGFVADPGVGDLEIQAGVFTFQGYVGLGDTNTTITIRTNATLEVQNTGDSLTYKPIAMDAGACILSQRPNIVLPPYCSLNGPITLGGADVFDVVAGATVILNAEVGGSGSLIKGVGYHPTSGSGSTGAGLLVLNASNSFTGDLSIQTGTVALTNDTSVAGAANIVLASGTTLDASGRSDGTLTLASGQTLKGSGTVVGTVLSPSGSTVSPGASIGAVSVNGSVTLRGNTVMEIALNASVKSGDLVAVSGTLDLGGTLTVTYSGDKLQTGDTFTLFTAGTFNNAFTIVNLPVVSGIIWTNKTALDGSIAVLSAPIPAQPTVSGGTALPGGSFQLNFNGPSGYGYSVRASTEVTLPASSWQVLGTGTFGASPASFVDPNAPNYQQRFYLISIP